MCVPTWLWPSARKTAQQLEWEENLTPERRQHFESVGEDLVKRDVDRYMQDSKKFAALAWLGEKRQKQEVREGRLFRLVLLSVILSAIGVYLAWAGS